MNQAIPNTEQLAATQYVVPVQSLQSLPQLASASPPATAPQSTTQVSVNWFCVVVVVGIWTCVVALAFDLLYGGTDVRAIQAQTVQAQRETAQLQQTINAAAAALGCPSGGAE